MGKMSELSLLVKELNQCGETLISISESLASIFSGEDESKAISPTTPEISAPEEKTITLEEVIRTYQGIRVKGRFYVIKISFLNFLYYTLLIFNIWVITPIDTSESVFILRLYHFWFRLLFL